METFWSPFYTFPSLFTNSLEALSKPFGILLSLFEFISNPLGGFMETFSSPVLDFPKFICKLLGGSVKHLF